MSDRITDVFFPFFPSVLVYTHVCVGVFTRTPFLLSDWWIQLLSGVDGATVDAWLYFPGLKVGQTFISIFFLFKLFAGVDYQS
jgi:hypothetical protein